ncbi:uncharacterized protein PG998_006623 [Apiospora kogelbergensis]|uniref:uncharacterized protein n=1 Tax=Apiospora kogelbergensis TaxID=1337665 RepID=UPI00312E591E
MAPNSRIILTRHAQAEHNVDLDYSILDAPLTPLGKKQAESLARLVPALQAEADLVVSSPLRRTLQTTALGWAPAVERLGGLKRVLCLPQAQECNALPCDTGSPARRPRGRPGGFWAADDDSLANRARWVRRFLRGRPEKTIVLVAHGDILRQITASPGQGKSDYMWKNAEVRVFEFDPQFVDSDEAYLFQRENVAAAGGYAPTSSEIEIEETLAKI